MKKISFLFIALLFCFSCQEEESGLSRQIQTANISGYIDSLIYTPEQLLNVQETDGAPNKRVVLDEQVQSTRDKGVNTQCETKVYSLKNNFEDVAILRPTNGIVWPGALVYGNASMLDGLPDPVSLQRGPVKMRLDLPGIGEKGEIVVESPANSNVQSAIDEALNWWNDNAYLEGYVNASNSYNQISTSYSSKQLSLDVGLNVEWAQGDVATQFNFVSNSSEKVAMMVFKQVFYTISVDPPTNPGDVFGKDVSVEEVRNTFGSEKPPAYVHSVSYGRIIMFRMQTTAQASDTEIAGSFNYASGFTNASGDTETKYKEILSKSSITTITIGGNAEVASEAITAQNYGDLQSIITGKNAVYSKSNPGVPIAYTVRYLKDNKFAKMGYTTEYQAEDCRTIPVPAARVNVKNSTGPGAAIGWDMQYSIKYKDKNGKEQTINSGKVIKGNAIDKEVPSGSYDIRLRVEYVDGTVWKKIGDASWEVPTNACFQLHGSWEAFGSKVPKFRKCP